MSNAQKSAPNNLDAWNSASNTVKVSQPYISSENDDETVAVQAPPKRTRASSPRKFFVISDHCDMMEFDSLVKAERYLNSMDAPEQYTVIRGTKIETNKKVSLR